MTNGQAVQEVLNEIAELRSGGLSREERVSLIQAEASLRLAQQIERLVMPVASASSHILGLHKHLDNLVKKLDKMS